MKENEQVLEVLISKVQSTINGNGINKHTWCSSLEPYVLTERML